jgi:hypothetical protein
VGEESFAGHCPTATTADQAELFHASQGCDAGFGTHPSKAGFNRCRIFLSSNALITASILPILEIMTFVELTAEPVIAPTLDQVGLGLAKISSLQQPLSSDSAEVSTSSTIIVISSVTVITGISSLLAGLVTVGLPTIAKDLNLAPNLLLW